MEQMNSALAIQSASQPTVSTTTKSAKSADQGSFSEVYDQKVADQKPKAEEKADVNRKNTKEQQPDKTDADNGSNSVQQTESKAEKKTEPAEDSTANGISWQAVMEMIPLTSTASSENSVEAEQENAAESESQPVTGVTGGQTETIQATAIENAVSAAVQNDEELVPQSGSSFTQTVQTDVKPVQPNDNPQAAANVQNQKMTAEASSVLSTENVIDENNKTVLQDSKTPVMATANTGMESMPYHESSQKPVPQSVQMDVLNQIQQSFGKVIKSGNQEIRIQLTPENLGTLNIRIIAGKDGTQVLIKTDNLQSSQLIGSQVDTLKTMMAESGIKVDQVFVNDFSFSQQNFANQNQANQQTFKPFYKGSLANSDQTETWDNPYEIAQSVVGLNYLA